MTSYRALMYSFKGGAGRTVTTANVAYLLATEHNKRVLVIDLDVESAGASVLFEIDDAVEHGDYWTVQDVLRGYYVPRSRDGNAAPAKRALNLAADDFEKKVWPKLNVQTWPAEKKADGPYLRVLPARRILYTADEATGEETNAENFDVLLEQIDGMANAPDIVLFDSASGIQSSAMMALERANVAFVFARWSRQFVKGTLQFVDENICSPPGRRLDQVFIVPTAVPENHPSGTMREELSARRDRLEKSIWNVNHTARTRYAKSDNWVRLFDPPIREADALKWDDKIVCKEGGQYIESFHLAGVLSDYRRIATEIVGLAAARAATWGN